MMVRLIGVLSSNYRTSARPERSNLSGQTRSRRLNGLISLFSHLNRPLRGDIGRVGLREELSPNHEALSGLKRKVMFQNERN
jgi:hypothetical protein